ETKTISNTSEAMLSPKDFGVDAVQMSAITGGDDVAGSAQIFMDILQGKGTEAQNHVVCANAGMAIATVESSSPKEGFEKAKASLLEGKGLDALKKLQELSRA
ncbi:MAG: anthranilate phosphoribosyltransferase, partial [Bacteroidota bacterium]